MLLSLACRPSPPVCSWTADRRNHPRHAASAGTSEAQPRSEEHTSELQSRPHLVCRLLLEKKTHVPVLRQCRIRRRPDLTASTRDPLSSAVVRCRARLDRPTRFFFF